MKVIFKRPRIVGGKLYAKSAQPHDVPDHLSDHWFVKALIKEGDITLVKSEAQLPNAVGAEVAMKKKSAPQSQKKSS